MKKIAIFSVLITLVAAFFFTACEKEKSISAVLSSGYANTDNPFDFVGAKHNECLDILAQYGTLQTLGMEKAFQILAEHGQEAVDFKAIKDEMVLVLASGDPIKDLTTKMLKEGRISQTLFDAMAQLNRIVQSYGFTGQLNQEVVTFESTFISLSLPDQELQFLYSASSIARHSNAYWSAKNADQVTDRVRKCNVVLGADIVGAGVGIGFGGITAVASAAVLSWGASELFDLFNTVISNGGGQYGWRWGGGIYGPPCNPFYACPCTIEPGGGQGEPFYMSGLGFVIDPSTVLMTMDGSSLDPGFAEIFNTGIYDEAYDFTVPLEIVERLYHASGLEVPAGSTVFSAGPKEVLALDNIYIIDFPVTYEDGTEADWYVTIVQ